MRKLLASDTMETEETSERCQKKEVGRKVPSSLWEEGQKMWMLNVGRDSSGEGHAKGRGLCQLLEGDTGSYYIRLEDEACSWTERKGYGRR